MAKSNGFFSLRRGSTKSLTFSVLNGRQITKDRVSQVRNPKTQRQQYQRAIMATVMAAYSRMKAIEDHAFEGASGKAANQQRFMSANAKALRAQLALDLTKEETNMVVLAPKYPTIVPNAYVISEGSLTPQKFLTWRPAANQFEIDEAALTAVIGKRTSVEASEVLNALGIYDGLQITFCFISKDSGIPFYPGTGEDGTAYARFDFNYARLGFKVNSDFNINFSERDEARDKALTAVVAVLKAYAMVADNTTPSIKNFLAGDKIVSVGDSVWGINSEEMLRGEGYDESTTFALGIITSVKDTDLRSNASMQTKDYLEDGDLTGIFPAKILDIWQGEGLVVGDSEKYLEGGDD